MTEHPDRTDTTDTTDRIEVDAHIEAPPAEVLDYLADPDRRPFGRDDYLTLGDQLPRESDPDAARIAWEVTVPNEEGTRLPGTVEVLIRPEGTGTRILVTHHIHAAARPLALAA